MFVVKIYVDGIVFGRTSQELVDKFVKKMTSEFEMSMVG